MKKQDEIPTTNPSEIEALIKRVEGSPLSKGDRDLITRLLKTMMVLLRIIESKNASISRLKKMLFGPRGDKQEQPQRNQTDTASEQEQFTADQSDAAKQSLEEPANKEERKERKGHGRLAASKYTGAKTVRCIDPLLQAGSQCPHPTCGGRLYDPAEIQKFVRFESRPFIDGTIYEQKVLRCRVCEARFSAPLPEGVPAEKFDATADAAIALLKYASGMPFYRLAKLQALMGIPLPASTQFMRCEAVADIVCPVYLEMARQAAVGEVVCGDDTTVKILACLAENKQLPKDARTGLQTTGIGALVGERTIALYYSGRRHTGENLYELLQRRPAHLDLPTIMADAAAKNWTPEFQRIAAKCLQHARKYFKDARPAFHGKCRHVLDKLAEVYKNESVAKEMTPEQRLAYHRQHSEPIMTELKAWMEQQLASHEVEENDALGKAIRYFLNHYSGLTQFLKTADAPLDNNLAERILKRAVLNRKNSLFYKTEHGAAVGDIITSLVETCALSKANAFDYLVALLRNARAVRAAPEHWLAWNYLENSSKQAA
jgi:hypothetical protein